MPVAADRPAAGRWPNVHPASPAKRVGVKLEKGWHKRNFFVEVFLPSLLERRNGTPNAAPLFPKLAADQIGITWIGHASFLLQMAGLNILVDPNWSLWLKGIKRLKTPGVPLHELPMIDLVLVTHAHFDHLDRRTLRAVAANQPIVVPFGVGNLVHDLGFERVHELDYWGTFTVRWRVDHADALPSLGRAAAARSAPGLRRVRADGGGRSVFHCGDTAYFDGFAEIGRRCPVEIALLPIGAYDTPSQRAVHMNPEEAVHGVPGTGREDARADALRDVPAQLRTAGRASATASGTGTRGGRRAHVRLMEEGRPEVF